MRWNKDGYRISTGALLDPILNVVTLLINRHINSINGSMAYDIECFSAKPPSGPEHLLLHCILQIKTKAYVFLFE